MYPDTLYLHGERGTILALSRFAKLAGFEPAVHKIDFDTTDFRPDDYDVIFFGPGEICVMPAVRDSLMPYKNVLIKYIAAGRPIIVTGTSVALTGASVVRADGTEFEGLGLTDSVFTENESVYGDDVYFKCEYNGRSMELIGNQIQMGDLDIRDETPFGSLIYGYGNSGKDLNEGIKKENSVFTNSLGPLLLCNPWLTEEIVRVAAMHKGISDIDFDFDQQFEKSSFDTKKEFILTKETNLTNCSR